MLCIAIADNTLAVDVIVNAMTAVTTTIAAIVRK